MKCKHAASGCNYPEGDCGGDCVNAAKHTPAFECAARGDQECLAYGACSEFGGCVRSAEATQSDDIDLDAWECSECGGAGKYTVYHKVTHQLGTDELPFMDECETCNGVGWCGPDAEKRSAFSKAIGSAA